MVGTGDMVSDGVSETDWQTFFDIEGELLRDKVELDVEGIIATTSTWLRSRTRLDLIQRQIGGAGPFHPLFEISR